MAARLVKSSKDSIRVEVEISLGRSLLESEELIQKALNEAGTLATLETFSRFDADGSPIQVGAVKFTSKGRLKKTYQTPYGEAEVERYVYQSATGGKTYCPLEITGRMIMTATPRFAKILSYKYADLGLSRLCEDMEISHGRKVLRSYAHKIGELVGSVAQLKEEAWTYSTPLLEKDITTVTVGLDGTCMLMHDDGWREAMVGTVALYDKEGERQHTLYIGSSPEYGKETFLSRLEREIGHVKQSYGKALFIGLADGAKSNWPFLKKHTERQVVDFYHAVEYLVKAAEAYYDTDTKERKAWLDSRCHDLKHKRGAAQRILREMDEWTVLVPWKEGPRWDKLRSALDYFMNNIDEGRMSYGEYVKENLPIGSGVTEAACKVIVKQRLCNSGMRWKTKGAQVVLSLRCLTHTPGRWNQFWEKIDQYGFQMAA